MLNTSILKKIIVTEKSMRGVEGDKKVYVFKVDKKSTKKKIKAVVEEVYGVQVETVNTLNTKGKVKIHKQHKGKRSDYKKAFVKLKSGQIDISENM